MTSEDVEPPVVHDEVEEDQEDDVDMVDYDEEIEKVKTKLSKTPENVKLTETLMGLLKKNGDFEELDKLRQKTSAERPISSDSWLDWIKDKKEADAEKEEVEKLYEAALFDHNSLSIWLDYIQWTMGLGDFAYTREKMEAALTHLGLHVDCGSLIWHACIDFEKLIYRSDPADEKQKQRLISLYTRALRAPTKGLIGIWEDYLKFCDNNPIAELTKIHSATATALKKLMAFENKFAKNPDEVYAEYLNYELESDDPGRIQSFYERAAEKYKTDETVWLDYGKWCDTKLKLPSVSCRLYERAVRHCSYSLPLWQCLLASLERANAEPEKIDGYWLKAKDTIQTADDGRALYRTYIYLLRRRVAATGGDDYSVVEAVFADGKKVLEEYFGHEWDPSAEYRRNYAYFLFSLQKDVQKGRTVWQDILASGGGRLAERWLEAVRLERHFGDAVHARKLLYKALNSVSDHPGQVFEYFIQFEREEGTLQELDTALEKVNTQLAHRSARPQKQQQKEEKHKKEEPKTGGRKRQGEQENQGPPKKVQKEKEQIKAKEQPPAPAPPIIKDKDGFTIPTFSPAKKNKKPDAAAAAPQPQTSSAPEAEKNADGKWTVFVSNLDFKVTEDKIREVLDGVVEIRLVYRGASKLHKGYAFVDLDSEKSYKEALKKDRTPIDGRPMLISVNDPEKRTGFRYKTGMEKSKVFVRNVHFDCTGEQLKDLFSQFGEVVDVRVVTHKSGKAKGVAYVEFKTEDAAHKSVDAQELFLLDRKLSVAISNPPTRDSSGISTATSIAPEGARRSHLQIVPRSVAKPSGASTSNGKPAGSATPKAMSNDQFRNFLSK